MNHPTLARPIYQAFIQQRRIQSTTRWITRCLCISALLCVAPRGTDAQTPLTTPDPELVATMQRAQSLLGQGSFSEAESELRKAAEKFPNKPSPWYLLGYTLHAQKKYDEALPFYEKAATFEPTKKNSLYNIACIHSIKNDPDKAFASLESAIKAGFTNFGQLQGDADFTNIQSDPRFKKLLPKWLTDDQIFIEPTRIIHQWIGESAQDQFGWTARRVGDIDGDGATDVIATAPSCHAGAGRVYVYSAKSGELLHTVTGGPGDGLGNSATGVGDINSDGIPDFIAGAPASAGKGAAYVYSGKDASIIYTLKGKTQGGQFGYEVNEAGDFDGDNVPDFFVGEMNGNGNQPKSGKGYIYSGKSGEVLLELKGEKPGDCFGNAAAITKIGDQRFLVAIGAQNAGPTKRGRVYVFDINHSDVSLRFTIDPDKNSVNLGQMFISFPGDLDQDGVLDVYASDFSDSSQSRGGGKVVIHSGSDGRELVTIAGKIAGEGLGTSPSDAGDVDGDGIGDLVIGAWQNNEGAPSGGKVYLYSMVENGKLLRTWTCKQSGDTFGFDACGIGDVDGDGHVDFLLTSAWSNVKGPKTGRVFVVAGEDYSK